jgi:hypothetical protein
MVYDKASMSCGRKGMVCVNSTVAIRNIRGATLNALGYAVDVFDDACFFHNQSDTG